MPRSAGMARRRRCRLQPGPAAAPRRVFEPRAAGLAAAILVNPFPAGGPPGIGWKTGTSWGGRDAWAMGFDARHVVGIWVGRPDGTPLPGATGARTALPLLARVFERLPANPRQPLPARPAAPVPAAPLDRLRLAFPPPGAVLEEAAPMSPCGPRRPAPLDLPGRWSPPGHRTGPAGSRLGAARPRLLPGDGAGCGGGCGAGGGKGAMTTLFIDGDACPVREEAFRVATRLGLPVKVVSNGSRPVRPPGLPNVEMVLVPEGADAADDWIAERATRGDVCITADIPLAARCLAKGARALSFKGRPWTTDNIGGAVAGRAVSQGLRDMGQMTGGPAPLTKVDRSRFLAALDTEVAGAMRDAAAPPARKWVSFE